jgi:hypothetical protein
MVIPLGKKCKEKGRSLRDFDLGIQTSDVLTFRQSEKHILEALVIGPVHGVD